MLASGLHEQVGCRWLVLHRRWPLLFCASCILPTFHKSISLRSPDFNTQPSIKNVLPEQASKQNYGGVRKCCAKLMINIAKHVAYKVEATENLTNFEPDSYRRMSRKCAPKVLAERRGWIMPIYAFNISLSGTGCRLLKRLVSRQTETQAKCNLLGLEVLRYMRE